MNGFDMFDSVAYELDAMRRAYEAEESKRDCEGCRDRIGIPCLVAKSCKKFKKEGSDG